MNKCSTKKKRYEREDGKDTREMLLWYRQQKKQQKKKPDKGVQKACATSSPQSSLGG